MEILILNAGSSSVKFRLYKKDKILLDGIIDCLGPNAVLEVVGRKPKKIPVVDAREAGLLILSLLGKHTKMVVHRVVHGGQHTKPALLTDAVVAELEDLIPLAPLHLPPALTLIALFKERLGVKQVACFDTMFHRTMPLHAKTYAIPQDLAKKYSIEHYGFHGMAHEALMRQAAERMGKKPGALRLITCQLGNGDSVCAINKGKSVDTSMGFTPLQGLVMGTRSGDIDPAIVEFLCEQEGRSVEWVMDMLEKRSGLLALGGSNDVRELLKRERQGAANATLALDIFAYMVRKRIGSYITVLGGVDAIVFGGGIPRAPSIRERILTGLEELGIVLHKGNLRKKMPVQISTGPVQVWVLDVDEAERMFELTKRFRPRR